ncbi:hypothetical protein ABWH96_07265 [Marivirga tractuosa]|uniref:hypothetical protein n=1 Tax=Marivirga tractuosa TaxID=1006 RepID=UPI0035CF3726
MKDPREILSKKLTENGISLNIANIIALDAGSSQVSVDKAYLKKYNFSESQLKTVIQLVSNFYSGIQLE